MQITKQQIIQFNVTLSSLGIQDLKRDIILQYSNGRTDSTKEMTEEEARVMLGMLNANRSQYQSKPGNKIRRSVMSMAFQIGVINSNMNNAEKIAAIDEYVRKHPKTGTWKPFSSLSIAELQKLHYQFEVFLKHHLNKM